jgi:hypothetical protein
MKRRSILKTIAAIPATVAWMPGSNSGRNALVSAAGVAPGTYSEAAQQVPADVSRYDVIWTTPSHDSLGSMPLGDGSTGLSVWVEEDGDLLFLMGRSDTPDHHKVRRIRVKLTPNPFDRGRPTALKFKAESSPAFPKYAQKCAEKKLQVVLGEPQPRVSELLNPKIGNKRVDRLLHFRPRRRWRGRRTPR